MAEKYGADFAFRDLPKRAEHADFVGRAFTVEEMRWLGQQQRWRTLGFIDCPLTNEHLAALAGLPRLVRLFVEGTNISDEALIHIAAMPELEFLSVDRTKITGEGFVHFHQHLKLGTLWASKTRISDQTVGFLAGIPNLRTLRIADTSVTAKGLLPLSVNSILTVVSDTQFTEAEIEGFEAAQREAARIRSGTRKPTPAECEPALQALHAFFEAMNSWEANSNEAFERDVASGNPRRSSDADKAVCAAVFAKYCTEPKRKMDRPFSLFWQRPPSYSHEVIIDTERKSAKAMLFYTRDRNKFIRRYLVKLTKDGWRVDRRETKAFGWTRQSL